MRLIAVGVSHHSAPLEVRERVSVRAGEAVPLLRYLVGHSGLSGAAVLSTCNRTEFYVTCSTAVSVAEAASRFSRYLEPERAEPSSSHIVTLVDEDAVRHMFRVAAGLESMVVGEAQVLGQFKDAHELARHAQTLDPRLAFVMRRAISVGKRVRTETAIGRGLSSLSDAAVEWARMQLGTLEGRGALLLGAGEMSALAARRLTSLGARVFITTPSGHSAASLASQVGGFSVPGGELAPLANEIELVISSTDSTGTVLDVAGVEALQSRRDQRPLYIVDIAVPRDVHPGVASVPGVALVDVDGLGTQVAENAGGRRRAVHAAEAVVEEEVIRTVTAIKEGEGVSSTIATLAQRSEELRRREVERTLRRLPGADERTCERIEQLSLSLVRKLLHGPIAHLRESADDPGVALTLREAFDLDDQR